MAKVTQEVSTAMTALAAMSEKDLKAMINISKAMLATKLAEKRRKPATKRKPKADANTEAPAASKPAARKPSAPATKKHKAPLVAYPSEADA